MPHGHCYFWRPDILWTHVISDLIIAAAYYAIPIVLAAYLIKQRKVVHFPEIIALFAAFILLCGTTHLVSIYVTWHPLYELQGWLKAITALISIATAVVLIPKFPQLIALPGLQTAYEKSLVALAQIKEEKADMQAMFDVATNRETRILELKQEVNALLLSQGQASKYMQGNTP